MAKRKTQFTQEGIKKLPNDKPALYKIQTSKGKTNYVGIAKRGRVQDRIEEHRGKIPGSKVNIEQFSSIKGAAKKERNVIQRTKPKYNKKGK